MPAHSRHRPSFGYRTLATFFGGGLMACVWLPQPARWTPLAVLAASGLVGVAIAVAPGIFPTMIVDGDGFTPLAQGLNVAGGVGLLDGMLWFGRSPEAEHRLLAIVCLLFGAAGLSFPRSHAWAAD